MKKTTFAVLAMLALVLTIAGRANGSNCNGPGDDNCGGTTPTVTCIDQTGAVLTVNEVCAPTVATTCEAAIQACSASATATCPPVNVSIETHVLRCAKVKELPSGKVVRRNCLVVTEAVNK